ncbi:MAG TPA: helicase-related protein [Polyangiaceae bacterium]|nr:helicase-related protein [Polyangiaceae bacterium]
MTVHRTSASAQRRSPVTPPVAYAPGARVEIRSEEWIVRRAELTSAGTTAVHVTGQSELVRDKDAIFLDDIDTITVLRPEDTKFVADPSPQYRRTKLYLESLLRQTPPTDSKLSVGHRGAMDTAAYQLVPAARALKAPRARLLIADAVGLGKTIEVGILLSELIRRGRGRRILVVTLKSVLEQFQKELWSRFTLPLVRLDSVGLERVQRQIPANHNPFYRFDRVIISVDTLKKDEKYRRFLQKCHWDVIAIDECQHVADRGDGGSRSQRSRLARMLASTCDSLILTSATPHDGSPESFASLMNLLDPTAVADPQDFTREDVESLYVRRFKKDIAAESAGSFSERRLHPHHVTASPNENAVYEALARARFSTIHPRLPGRAGAAADPGAEGRSALFRTLLLKSFLSSAAALASTLEERSKRQTKKLSELEREGRLTPELRAAHEADQSTLQHLQALCAQVQPAQDTKLRQLISLIRPLVTGKGGSSSRVVIFSERIATLQMLSDQLQKSLGLKPEQVGLFHGSLDDVEQQQLVRSFGSLDSPVRILLASDAASEGINLHHHCHNLVHYDIPWSLITLEQRNGRVDRYGQEHEPQLHYLLSVPANGALQGDLRVLDVLIEKEAEAHKNLGDVRWLMGLSDPADEEARVIDGVSRHEPPERILQPPPAQQLSLLEQLMAGARAPAAPASSPPASSTGSVDLPETEAPFRLYPDDASYLKVAFDELVESQPEGLPAEHRLELPEWHDNISGFRLNAPADLRQRYAYLPPELRHVGGTSEWTFTLSADRARVQRALIEARERDTWPALELLWELHPIATWVNDRVVCHFGRHEAPVLHVASGLAKDEWVYLFQGVLSNQRSAPVLVDWFGVRTVPKRPATVESPRNLAALVGLDQPLVNRTQKFDAAGLGAACRAPYRPPPSTCRRSARGAAGASRPSSATRSARSTPGYSAARRPSTTRARSPAPRAESPQRLRSKNGVIWSAIPNACAPTELPGWTRLKTSDQPYLRLCAVIGATALPDHRSARRGASSR